MTVAVAESYGAGWFWFTDGSRRRAFAHLTPAGRPQDAILMECSNWWNALALALHLAAVTPGCVFEGGPDE